MPRRTRDMKNVGVMLNQEHLEKLEDVRHRTDLTSTAVMRKALSFYHRMLQEMAVAGDGAKLIIRDGDMEKEIWIV